MNLQVSFAKNISLLILHLNTSIVLVDLQNTFAVDYFEGSEKWIHLEAAGNSRHDLS